MTGEPARVLAKSPFAFRRFQPRTPYRTFVFDHEYREAAHPPAMRLIGLIALGGAAGAVARYALGGLVQPSGSIFPWGTLTVNILGAFVLGFLMRYLLGSAVVSPDIRLALTIGLCGSFTTMSTFSYETVALMQVGNYWRAAGYVVGSLGGTVLAILGGGAFGARLL